VTGRGLRDWELATSMRRHRLLVELLDQFDAEQGPVDESLVGKYMEILG